MSLDNPEELCRILKTGKQDSQNYELSDELKKLSEAELLEFLKNNEKEIINGVIDTFSKCGIKITANNNKVIIKSPGYYTVTNDVETGEQTKAEAEAEAETEAEAEPEAEAETQTIPEAKPKPKTKPGFGSSAPRFPTTKSRVPGGTKFTGRNITKKNRANLTHLKKNIRGMVMNGGKGRNFIEDICIALVVVPLRLPSITIMCIKYVCRKIYNHFNDNSSKVVPTNYDDNARVEPINYDDNENANSLSIYNIGLGITNNNQGKAFVIYKAVEENNLDKLNNAISKVKAQVKDKSILKSILDTEFNKQGKYTATSLMVACEKNKFNIVETLLKNGADVNKQTTYVDSYSDTKGITALYIASQSNLDYMVKLLLTRRANPNLATTEGKTPLYEACIGYGMFYRNDDLHYKTIIDLLLVKGADINKADKYGRTAIFNIMYSKPLKDLIDAGADVNMADKNGETPLFLVTRYGTYQSEKQDSYLLVLNTLIEAKADINKANNNGETPLYVATQRAIKNYQEYKDKKDYKPILYDDIKIVQVLLEAGAKVYEETTDSNIKSPIDAVKEAQKLYPAISIYLSRLFDPYTLKQVTKYTLKPVTEYTLNKPSNILAKPPKPAESVLGNQDLNKVIEGYLGPPRLLKEESKEQTLTKLTIKKKSPFDAFNDGTPGGKNSRSKTRKQKRRKTKK